MDISRLTPSRHAPARSAGAAPPSKDELSPPADSVCVGAPGVAAEGRQAGGHSGVIRNRAGKAQAGAAGVLQSVAGQAQGLSLEAISRLFADTAGPLWTAEFPARHGSAGGMKLFEDGSLYAVGYKTLARFDTATGKVMWQKDFDKEPSTSSMIQGPDGAMLVMTSFDTLYSLDPATGKERWSYNCDKTGLWDPAPMAGSDGSVYTFRKDRLAVLTPQGKEKFKVKAGEYSPSLLGVDTSGQSVITCGNDVVALSPKGRELWRADGRNSRFFPGDREHVFIPRQDALEARDRESGEVRWSRPYTDLGMNGQTLLGAAQGKLVVSSSNMTNGTLLCLDTATGKTLWESKAPAGVESRSVRLFPESGTMTVSEGEKLHVLDLESGAPRWTLDIPAGRKLTEQALSPKGVLFVQVGDTVHGLDAATGKPLSQAKGFASPGSLAVAPDGTTVITQEYGSLKLMGLDGRSVEGKVEEAAREIAQDQANAKAAPGATVVEQDGFVVIDGVRLGKARRA